MPAQHGENGTIDLDTVLGEYVEGPWGIFADGEPGHAVVFNGQAGDVLESFNGPVKVDTELIGGQFVGELMIGGMRPDLMSALGYLPHNFGVGLGYPAQTEEGSAGILVVKNIEYPFNIGMDTARITRPLLCRFRRIVLEYMKPLFDIEGEYIHCK